MKRCAMVLPSPVPPLLPAVTYFWKKRERIEAGRIPPAHTDTDAYVLFTRAKFRLDVFCSFDPSMLRVSESSPRGLCVLRDYLREYYGPAARQSRAVAADGFRAARELAEWKTKVRGAWPGVTLKLLGATGSEIAFGERVTVEVHAGCGRCERCREGMYTSCHNYGLNYGDVDKGHRANGFTTDGGPRATLEHTHNRVPGLGWRAITKLQAEQRNPFAQSELVDLPDEDGWRWSVLARLAGDEFTMFFPHVETIAEVEMLFGAPNILVNNAAWRRPLMSECMPITRTALPSVARSTTSIGRRSTSESTAASTRRGTGRSTGNPERPCAIAYPLSARYGFRGPVAGSAIRPVGARPAARAAARAARAS